MNRRSFLVMSAILAAVPQVLLGGTSDGVLIHRGNTESDADRLERLIRTTGRAAHDTFVIDRVVDLTPYRGFTITHCRLHVRRGTILLGSWSGSQFPSCISYNHLSCDPSVKYILEIG